MIDNKQVTQTVSHNVYYVNFFPGGMLRYSRGIVGGMAAFMAGGWDRCLAILEGDLFSLVESLPLYKERGPGGQEENH